MKRIVKKNVRVTDDKISGKTNLRIRSQVDSCMSSRNANTTEAAVRVAMIERATVTWSSATKRRSVLRYISLVR